MKRLNILATRKCPSKIRSRERASEFHLRQRGRGPLQAFESSISGHALTMSAGPPSSSFVVIVVVVVVVVVEKPSMLPEKETSEKTCTIRHRLKSKTFC